MVPGDTVKYELDKHTGFLKVDRPQVFSSICPSPYGMIPRTWCGERVAAFCREKLGREDIVGDGDPLDICVLTDRLIARGDLVLTALPIGGFRMLDREEADDKIIAVLKGDGTFGGIRDIGECPPAVVNRLRHYFLTYKDDPSSPERFIEIPQVYGRDEALEVMRLAQEDYEERYGGLDPALGRILSGG